MKKNKLKMMYLVLLCGVVLLASCKNETCKDVINTYENSNHRIDLKRSKELYKNYNDKIKPTVELRQKVLINRKSKSNPDGKYSSTEYVLMNIDTLKCYIKFLEEVEKKNGQKITGIAIFLGANNSNELLKDKAPFNFKMEEEFKSSKVVTGDMAANADIRGRMTNFLAPTYRDNSRDYDSEVERHLPFYIMPDDSITDKYKGIYTSLLSYFNPNPNGTSGFVVNGSSSNSGEGGTSLNQNEFNQMPPKKPNGNQ